MLVFSLILGNIAGFLPTTLYAHAEALPNWATNAGFNDNNATWNSSTSTLQLTQNVDLSSKIAPSSDVTLDLNGKTISVANGFSDNRLIDAYVNIRITGNGTIDGAGSKSAIYCRANKTVTFESGTIQYSGRPSASGAVDVASQGTFVMTGGTIQNCTGHMGGGVKLTTGSCFYMTGGMIQNCNAVQGGGIYVGSGVFMMTGGTVSGNTASDSGGEVFVGSGYFFKTNDAVIGNGGIFGTTTQAYAVNYNSNGGSGSMLPQAVRQNSSTILKANAFTRDGYTFAGWNTLADGTGTQYAAGASVNTTNDMTLYAQWDDGSGNNNGNNNGGNGGNNNNSGSHHSGGSSHSETHVHSYTWVITSEPTAYENGEMVYQCSCGHIAARADIEASSKLVTDGIRSFSATAQGGTVKMDFGYYFSINKAFALAHDARADVTTIITYYYQGKHYEMTIPAGFNLLQMIDSKGWAGFRYIGSFPGIVTKEIP